MWVNLNGLIYFLWLLSREIGKKFTLERAKQVGVAVNLHRIVILKNAA